MIGPTELWIVLIIIVILFGGSKIPEIMKGLGKGIKEFKKAKNDLQDTAEDDARPEKKDPKDSQNKPA